jgi:hypothetical protein
MSQFNNFEVPCQSSTQKTQNEWISVKKSLPSVKNGYVDTLVLIRVKNKNKEDGIYLKDVCAFDGEEWSKRYHTWEDITDWMPIPD